MKTFFFTTALITAFCISAFTISVELPIGASLPKSDVNLLDVTGKRISLKNAAMENGLLVMFSCNTCPFVIENKQRTINISKYALAKKIGVVLINSNEAQRKNDDSFEAMKAYAATQGYSWPYLVDESSVIADAFGASRTPETFLFDKSGKLVYHGAIDDAPSDEKEVVRQHLKEAMIELLQNKEVTVKTSRSVGCGIKRLK